MASMVSMDLSPSPSLREQQRQIARERIVDAAAAEVLDRGLAAFSMPSVAERAGVSLRTIYNYFSSKEVLLDGLSEEFDRRTEALGGVDVEPDLAEISTALRTNVRVWEEIGALTRAVAAVSLERSRAEGGLRMRAHNEALTQVLRRSLAEQLSDLPEADLGAVAAMLRVIVSFDTYHRLTQEFGLEGERAAEVSAWAFDTLRGALAAGDRPFP